jgi:hypothetical protein
MLPSWRLRVCVSSPINFRMREPIFMKLGMYGMAPEPISTLVLQKSLPSVRVSVRVSLLSLLGNGLVLKVSAATNTHTTEEFLDASFSMPSVSY